MMTIVLIILGIILGIMLIILLLRVYITYLRRKLSLEQDFSKGIIDYAKTVIIVSQLDGTILLFNRYAQEITGFNADEVEGKKLYETHLLKDKEEFIKNMFDNIPKADTVHTLESHILSRNGSFLDILWNVSVHNDVEGKPVYIVSIGIDITERKKTERKLRESYEELEATHEQLLTTEEELKEQYDDLHKREAELKSSEERYRLAIEGVNDGVWDWDGSDGKLFMSKRCQTLLGYDNDTNVIADLYTIRFWMNLIHEDDAHRFWEEIYTYLDQPQANHFQIEYKTKEKNGEFRWMLTKGKAIWNTEGTPIRMAGSVTDITEQRMSKEKINHMAYYDSLTKLPNRALFLDRFLIASANAQRKNKMVAIYYLDLDNFKTVNDTIGHPFGDELISNVGRYLEMHFRRGDTVARMGGDEFIMMQTNIEEIEEISLVVSRVQNLFQQPWIVGGHEFYVTASIGITIYPSDGVDIQVLMKNADAAMYRAKELGKNNYQFFTNELNSRISERLDMQSCLRKAIEQDELVLHYQLQVDLQTGKTMGVEALLRWLHPSMGLIAPGKFIPLAEETGIIIPIGEWVLKTACKQNVIWHEQGNTELHMSVNLSAKQFQQRNLVEMIKNVLSETGMKPEWLKLEITESIAMKDLDHTISVLNSLNAMGIGVSLDDFGTEYSSLNYLKRLPINNLKIDKSFVQSITSGISEDIIAKALISLAHDMKLTVTAEGVETAEQLKFLMNEDCDIVQGYLLSRPMPADELSITLDKVFL